MSPQGGGTPGVPGPGEAWSWGWEGVLWGNLKAGVVSLGHGACSEPPVAQMFQLIVKGSSPGGWGPPQERGDEGGTEQGVCARTCVRVRGPTWSYPFLDGRAEVSVSKSTLAFASSGRGAGEMQSGSSPAQTAAWRGGWG